MTTMRIHLQAMNEDGTVAAEGDAWVPTVAMMRDQSREAWQSMAMAEIDELVDRADRLHKMGGAQG